MAQSRSDSEHASNNDICTDADLDPGCAKLVDKFLPRFYACSMQDLQRRGRLVAKVRQREVLILMHRDDNVYAVDLKCYRR